MLIVEANIRVLVVEDHPQLQSHLKLLLEDYQGIEVVGVADNGQQAVDLSAKIHPDVVLMDVVMPVMDGFTATAIIREKYPDIHVVILTNGRLGDKERAAEAGAGAFLLKPVSMEHIVGTIRKIYASNHKAAC